MPIHLSPTEATLATTLLRLGEAYGAELSTQSGVELATTYVLLERMAKRKILLSRVAERVTGGRRRICRLYKIAPNIDLPEMSAGPQLAHAHA